MAAVSVSGAEKPSMCPLPFLWSPPPGLMVLSIFIPQPVYSPSWAVSIRGWNVVIVGATEVLRAPPFLFSGAVRQRNSKERCTKKNR